ncbi:glycoside hydrolase family 3 N-terminal domain-containing protein [Oceanobacillus sp. J11TS1]|uniref:glycoside hydrolase family 3 N-terminal domain-containing protein n=1 Tax=Oceanobacillus sp. J11TS1 TaxID=2807191 RepID=UPI001B15DE08|nr:glycoside hydrolase family 3 N-terminal domain-containing protein [Oceanobacillus sp. J11TS1]GIO24170.1 hypothetical protein J11TS1_27510 [Oceanobacillus sp. J11TS1]
MLKKTLSLLSIPLLLSACVSTTKSDSSAEPSQTNQDSEHHEISEIDYQEFSDGVTTFGVVENPKDGPKISFSLSSDIPILTKEVDGETLYFKDLNNNGDLDIFEDWREDADTRAKELSEALSIDQIAGLMLFSSHEFDQSPGLTDDQRAYLENDDLRNILHAGPNDVEASVKWANQMQAFVEDLGSEDEPIVPVNFSSDPRSTAGSDAAYNAEGNDISRWPSNLGLAATFNPDVMRQFASMSSEEYRGLGITMALGSQIDLATEPRWLRVDGTFGEGSKLATEFAEAYTNYSQSTFDEDGNDLGWGEDSISIMLKHFPGDGAGEGGRESHLFQGKYAVFPGDNYEEHVHVFTDGGLNLTGETSEVASMMTSYSIQVDGEGNPLHGDEYLASAYNSEVVDILRQDNGYDGVLVTDWGVTSDNPDEVGYDTSYMGPSYGMEDKTVEERHFQAIKSGIDMFGGNNDKAPVLAAYEMWDAAYKNGELEISADERFRTSAKRIVRNFFQVGIFEDPYLNLEQSKEQVASEDKVEAGYQAQLDSVVMLKNKANTIKPSADLSEYKDKVVYIPSTKRTPFDSVFGPGEPFNGPTMSVEAAEEYFKEVITDEEVLDEEGNVIGFEQPENLDNVDLVIVGMTSPDNGGNFTFAGIEQDSETYYPLSLQYRPYTADGENVRQESIAGDQLDDDTKQNRSYYGNTSKISNAYDLDALLNTVELVEKSDKDIPIVVAMKAKNPVVMSEFEDKVDAIVVGFQVSDNALFDIILGKQEPKGLLPMQFPKNMDTVEAQFEDVSRDMEPYVDSEENRYDYGYGLDYDGVIDDERTAHFVEKD